MKRLFLGILCCFLAVTAIGCNSPESKVKRATSYGVVERCPVRVDISVDGDGKIVEISFDEYFSVYDIGELTLCDGEWIKCGVKIDEQVNGYAKYLRVGNMNFVMDGQIYVCDYEGERLSYDELIQRKQIIEWYESALKAEQYDIVTRDGESYGVPFDSYNGRNVTKLEWVSKLKNGFHEGVEYEYGYKENIYKLVTHIKNHGFYQYTGEEKPAGKEGTYKVGSYDTLVNLSGFHGYMGTALSAYNLAKESNEN